MSKRGKVLVGAGVAVVIAGLVVISAGARRDRGAAVRFEKVGHRDLVAAVTASGKIRPVMSALMSTFYLGWILPLAVTAATRSRCPTFSNRTAAPRSRRAPALITTSPAITTATPAPTSTLPRFDMFA